MTTGMMCFMTMLGWSTPMVEMPRPLFAVPYAAPRLAKTRAPAAPMKPKNGACGGYFSKSKSPTEGDDVAELLSSAEPAPSRSTLNTAASPAISAGEVREIGGHSALMAPAAIHRQSE